MNYKYTYLLKDEYEEINAIIFSNEEHYEIEKAIERAYEKWQELDTMPESETEYILQYLSEIFNIKYIDGLLSNGNNLLWGKN